MSMLQVNVTFFLAPAGKVGSKSKEDAPYELENQFVLRLPTVSICRFLFPSSVKWSDQFLTPPHLVFFCCKEYASTVRRIAQSSSMNMKDRLTIELHRESPLCVGSEYFRNKSFFSENWIPTICATWICVVFQLSISAISLYMTSDILYAHLCFPPIYLFIF